MCNLKSIQFLQRYSKIKGWAVRVFRHIVHRVTLPNELENFRFVMLANLHALLHHGDYIVHVVVRILL